MAKLAQEKGPTREEYALLKKEVDALQIEVNDDGKGMEDTNRAGVGLASMRERAEELGGTFAINRASPCGTQIMARLPLSEATKTSSRL